MRGRRLVVWRHGRTAWNAQGRFQGQADIPLDEVGFGQAAAAAPHVAGLRPSVLVASDLARAASTAAELSTLTGLRVEYDQDLREVDVGSWAGLTHAEAAAKDPRTYAGLQAGEDVRRGGDGETIAELAGRAEKALRRAAERVAEGETVVAAMHGLAGRVGIAALIGLPSEHWDCFGGMHNCAWAVCVETPNGWKLREWNVRALPSPDLAAT